MQRLCGLGRRPKQCHWTSGRHSSFSPFGREFQKGCQDHELTERIKGFTEPEKQGWTVPVGVRVLGLLWSPENVTKATACGPSW